MNKAEQFWTPARLQELTRGRWLHRPRDVTESPGTSDGDSAAAAPTALLRGLSIDSRTIKPGQVFLALRGDRFDGHDFLNDAVKAGAALLIVQQCSDDQLDRIRRSDDVHVLRVPDPLAALTHLATAYRRLLTNTTVIAITGSNGKTTTRRLLESMLSGVMRGTASRHSFNNHIGVPLTILAAGPRDRYLLVEIGSSAPGEVARLALIASPDIGVITSIGSAHLEGFGTVARVAEEKAALLRHLAADGFAVINADEPSLLAHVPEKINRVTFGHGEDADLRLSRCRCAASGVRFSVNDGSEWTVALHGEHNATNALAAIVVARRLGLSDQQIATGLATVRPGAMRFERQELAGLVIYNDAYNANPDSMSAALETFVAVSANAARRVVILGDMLELGEKSGEYHRELGRRLIVLDREQRLDLVVLIGPLCGETLPILKECWRDDRFVYFAQASDAVLRSVAALLRPGDSVLLKASRRLGLERVAAAWVSSSANSVAMVNDSNDSQVPAAGRAGEQSTVAPVTAEPD